MKTPLLIALAALLGGCTTLSPQALRGDVDSLAEGRIGVVAPAPATATTAQAVQRLLGAGPLSAEAAVRIALLNNPAMEARFAALSLSEADRVQAGQPPTPHLALGRLREGQSLEIERMLSFNVINLLTLPWRASHAQQGMDLAKLQAAQAVVRLAADTRKAWFSAVAAAQTAEYLQTAHEAAEAGAELALRMARTGNWSRLQQAREQAVLAELAAQLARSRQAAVAEREKLTRLMGLWGEQAQYTLPDRLPDVPAQLPQRTDIERQALSERLDVKAARDEAGYVAGSLGYRKVTGVIDALALGIKRNTTFDNDSGTRETARGFEVELPLPLFDWGRSNAARADAVYLQAAARVRDVAIQARSEAREAWHRWRTAHDLALHYRDEVVPLRKFISDETLLRYNGMLASVWDVLGETRNHVTAITGAIAAQRDFWLADTDLNTALTGTSPGALAALGSAATPAAAATQGH